MQNDNSGDTEENVNNNNGLILIAAMIMVITIVIKAMFITAMKTIALIATFKNINLKGHGNSDTITAILT